tara:strand:+ start:2196 stop:2369 length:174 start_codon:yes stop_codon:yes gene_type:complete
MRNKNLVQTKLERVENKLRSLNFAIGTNSREDAYKILDTIKNYLDDVNTLLNTETQD